MQKDQDAEIVANKDVVLRFENAGDIPLDFKTVLDIRWKMCDVEKTMLDGDIDMVDEDCFTVRINAADTSGMDNRKVLHEAKIVDETGTYALARGYLTILRTRFRDDGGY